MPWESRPVVLNKIQRRQLIKVAGSESSTYAEKCRALIVLLLSEGLKNKEVGQKLGVHENTVVKWRGRWTGDNDSAKVSDYGELTGRPRSILLDETLQAISKKANGKPPAGAPRWTVRSLAAAFNMPVATMQSALVELEINLSGPTK